MIKYKKMNHYQIKLSKSLKNVEHKLHNQAWKELKLFRYK